MVNIQDKYYMTKHSLKVSISLILLLVSPAFIMAGAGQAPTASDTADRVTIWPVSGTKYGEGIIGRPQQYIGSELNYGNLFIAAPLGSDILAPADGKIISISMDYMTSLTYMASYGHEGTFDEQFAKIVSEEENLPVPERYLNGSVSIRLEDGRTLHIAGLLGSVELKTGAKVKAGDVLGTASYAFKAFDEPHINLSLSDRQHRPDDIMAFLGLESTFKRSEHKIPESLTRAEAEEDIDILLDSYRELYPSIDDIVTEGQMEAFRDTAYNLVKDSISYSDFYGLVDRSTTAELAHDSHIWVLTEDPVKYSRDYVAHILPVLDSGRIIISQVQPGYEKYLRKQVLSIDGKDAGEYLSQARRRHRLYDADNLSIRERSELLFLFSDFRNPRVVEYVFEDGTSFTDTWIRSRLVSRYIPSLTTEIAHFKFLTDNRTFHFSRLNDSTVLFTLRSFELDQIQMERIADSIRTNLAMPNMVIDLRNNPGGEEKVMNKLLSYFLNAPSKNLGSYDKVNSNSTFRNFRNTANRVPEEVIFGEYEAIDGREGFYRKNDLTIMPDSLINYKGRIYVLTNESSQSAASLFPAILVRNHRAVTVGRETGSGYHYMTATQFADVLLPNSGIQVRVPLIKSVMEDLVTERTPAGRGLMPDYEIPLSYEEIYLSREDIFLDKVQELIAGNHYLGEDVFARYDNPAKHGPSRIWLILPIAVIAIICAAIAMRKK